MDIAEFVKARLDEDCLEALMFQHDSHWSADMLAGLFRLHESDPVVWHVARYDPARVLREVAAKRRILAGHGPGSTIDESNGKWRDDPVNWDAPVTLCTGHEWVARPCETVRLLAAVYSDHPDYRDEWKP